MKPEGQKRLTKKEKSHYLNEIKKDITFFKKTYRRADLQADITGLDAEAGAEMLEGLLARQGPPAPAGRERQAVRTGLGEESAGSGRASAEARIDWSRRRAAESR
ncbi:MAG: hypothetical protein ABII00_17690 [Elusimicrobiota bacterium]